ncbi:iojap-like ribosome-associated protein [Polaromonas sp. CF318]|uniref:ribosome silencing factor n=1 Tax=Polaromonas sp. CF318 TaxID=1144318 RepID=UPI00027144D9|nr:ribosome silencing factor [Polaromonas sp. CF318]EJL81277.1 iojap-like ribosome-associated protein [Polaromonas sp. CF318]
MTSTTAKTSAAADKKDVQKLQRAIIDGLEDVKAQDIQVFDTEHITSLFERVIVATGSSNRQTKALAASVRDAVRDAGFAKPRIEGEDNGEWIIVDCGAAVAHIMQPAIRQYYHLEEIWGDKPIKLKLGAPAPLVKASRAEAEPEAKPKASRAGAKTAARPGAKTAAKSAAKAPAKAPAKTADSSYVGRVGKSNDWTAKRNATATAAEPAAKPARAGAKAAPGKSAAKPAVKTPIIKVPAPKKVAARKTAAKTAGKTAAKKPAARKTAPRSK